MRVYIMLVCAHIIYKEEEMIFSTWSESYTYLICKYPTVS